MSKAPVAVLFSDVHLSHKPPLLRAHEPDWYEAMRRPLREVFNLGVSLNVPLICAGDVFDRWNSPAELINFAIQEFPPCYAIPGQHDLPNHNYDEIERSAYWTLVESKIITHLEPGTSTKVDGLELFGFPWGFDPLPPPSSRNIKIAVVHKYVWSADHKYATAPEEQHVRNLPVDGFDVIGVGDNHMGFLANRGSSFVCNCGGLMRRHSPDLTRDPFVGIVMSDGSVRQNRLDTSDDIYDLEVKENLAVARDFSAFTDGLLELKNSKDLDFGDVIKRYCSVNKVPKEVVAVIKKAIEDCK